MLFKNWVTQGTEATFIEEPGCSSSTPYAHEVTSNVSISGQPIHVAYNGMTFTAIRYNGIGSGGPPPNGPPGCDVGGHEGTCIETSACAAKAGHSSTPGYCPGPANIECCTADAPPPASPPTCHVDGVAGTCISTSSCAAKGGHHSTPGECPGPDSEECCTPNAAPPPPPPSGPSCSVEGNEGVCIGSSACSGMAGHVSTPASAPAPPAKSAAPSPRAATSAARLACASRPPSAPGAPVTRRRATAPAPPTRSAARRSGSARKVSAATLPSSGSLASRGVEAMLAVHPAECLKTSRQPVLANQDLTPRRFFGFLPDASLPVSRKRKALALAVATAADLLHIAIFPAFVEGAASPFDDALDAVTAVILLVVLGFSWRLAFALAAELVPGVALFPSWTAVVISVPSAPAPALPAPAPSPSPSDSGG